MPRTRVPLAVAVVGAYNIFTTFTRGAPHNALLIQSRLGTTANIIRMHSSRAHGDARPRLSAASRREPDVGDLHTTNGTIDGDACLIQNAGKEAWKQFYILTGSQQSSRVLASFSSHHGLRSSLVHVMSTPSGQPRPQGNLVCAPRTRPHTRPLIWRGCPTAHLSPDDSTPVNDPFFCTLQSVSNNCIATRTMPWP